MTIQQWEPEMSVGVDRMDDQHKVLLEILNDAFAASRARDEIKIFGIIDRLIKYTEQHFSEEERLLEASGYPALEEHKRIHCEFTKKVRDLNKTKYEYVNLMELFKFLNEWLIRHIMEVDKQYEEFVRESAENDQ